MPSIQKVQVIASCYFNAGILMRSTLKIIITEIEAGR